MSYRQTRHNIGFRAVKAFAKDMAVSFKKEKAVFALTGGCRIKKQKVILSVPLTFMNLSGHAVSLLLKKYKVNLADLLVIYDDLDLEFGRIKMSFSGSSGGHRGIESIIESLGNKDFCRLRLGIGRPRGGKKYVARYVLSPFKLKEKEQLKQIVLQSSFYCETWAREGIIKAMNICNSGSVNSSQE